MTPGPARPGRTPPRGRRLALASAWAAVAGLAVLLAAFTAPGPSRLTGLQVIAQVVALRGLVAVVAAGLGGVAALASWAIARRFGRRAAGPMAAAAAALALAAAGHGIVLADRGGAMRPGAAPWHGEGLVVLGLNTESEVSPERLADLVAARGADVVGLPETSRSVAERTAALLEARGLDYQVLSEVLSGGTNPSTSLLVATSVGTYQVADRGPAASFVATGTGPPLVVVHTRAPVDPDLAGWTVSTQYPIAACHLLPGAIVVGDFNATLDHPAFADLGPCQDAAAAVGSAATGTWPSTLPRALAAPIDHVLVDPAAWEVTRFAVLEPPGTSDHRAIEAVLVPAAG